MASRVDRETPQSAADTTGESELARRIEKKKHAFTHAVALPARPKANPLRDGQILARSGSANRIFNMEGDGHRFHTLAVGCRTTRDRAHRPRENGARGASEHGETKWARR